MQRDSTNRDQAQSEAKRLLSAEDDWLEMAEFGPGSAGNKNQARVEARYTDDAGPVGSSILGSSRIVEHVAPLGGDGGHVEVEYKVYKRRWFGLTQLILLNIIVSWDWLSFSPVANTTADFYSTTPSIINWLSTAFLFAFLAAAPLTIYTLHTGGPRLAIITSSSLILFGNWIRYAGTRSSPPSFGLTMFGQILIGFAQPFVLSAPTHYSSIWFTPSGRVSATAIASLANPFGGALGQLINPLLATSPHDIPNMTLYVALISTITTLPSFFVPSRPPTPVSASSAHQPPSLRPTLRLLLRNPTFHLLLLPFAILVGLFNSLSSLLTQILTPYAFTETSAGIAGALLILVGLLTAAITSPIVDRTKAYLPLIKTLVPVIATCYLAFIWAPGTRSVAAPYVILSVLGAASFSLVPVALEWLAEVTWPVGPEAGSTIFWAGGQLLGGVFIVVSDGLKAGEAADPPYNMRKALIFQAAMAAAAVPCALALGWVGRVGNKRLEIDERGGGQDPGEG